MAHSTIITHYVFSVTDDGNCIGVGIKGTSWLEARSIVVPSHSDP